jgi:pilus assembly protein Flp/PilA
MKYLTAVKKFVTGQEEGASLAEYGLLLALIPVVCLAAITVLATKISLMFATLATLSETPPQEAAGHGREAAPNTASARHPAKSLTALSSTVDEINSGLRVQVGLDRPPRKGQVIEHKTPATSNGKDSA